MKTEEEEEEEYGFYKIYNPLITSADLLEKLDILRSMTP